LQGKEGREGCSLISNYANILTLKSIEIDFWNLGAFSYFGSYEAPSLKIKVFDITMKKLNKLINLKIKLIAYLRIFAHILLCNFAYISLEYTQKPLTFIFLVIE